MIWEIFLLVAGSFLAHTGFFTGSSAASFVCDRSVIIGVVLSSVLYLIGCIFPLSKIARDVGAASGYKHGLKVE